MVASQAMLDNNIKDIKIGKIITMTLADHKLPSDNDISDHFRGNIQVAFLLHNNLFNTFLSLQPS